LSEHLEQIWQFIEHVERSSNAAEVERCLLEVAARYGFHSIFSGIVPTSRVSIQEIKSRIIFQKMPSEWSERYNGRAYVFRDPIVHRLRIDPSPFAWSDAYTSCPFPDDVALIRGEASEFGLRVGHVVPVSLLDGSVGAVSFGGDHSSIGPEGRAVLGFVASYALGSFLHHRESRRRLPAKLTPREFDCLLWASEGKTDWEIGVIQKISKSTVSKHILSAREKLGAVTKGHAIAIALRSKLIR
jgi:LuxR family transcriptional regulator, quorum-sensing system regulator BjaR1